MSLNLIRAPGGFPPRGWVMFTLLASSISAGFQACLSVRIASRVFAQLHLTLAAVQPIPPVRALFNRFLRRLAALRFSSRRYFAFDCFMAIVAEPC